MPSVTQKHRMIAVNSPLGGDVLVFGRMTATEQLGRLFEFDLEMFSEKEDISPASVLGKNMTVRLDLPNGTRYFNGFVTRFVHIDTHSQRYDAYRATLSPWLWFLTRTSDCRIFQNKKVPDIIKEIFREHGFSDAIKDSLSESYGEWEYCVQYRETDFNFVSRMMEQEGIYYYFTHENGKHVMVLADAYSSHKTFPDYAQVPYFPPDVHDHRERDHLSEWITVQQIQPGAYALNDFDFKAPRKDLKAVLKQPKGHPMADFEMYDYPGEYIEKSDGNSYSKIRLQELLAQHEVAHGRGNAAGLATGYLFSLTQCPRDDQNREYLIISAVHRLEADDYESVAGAEGTGKPYRCDISAIDAQQPFRAARLTPKPLMQGPQTAIVVGKSGEEIWTDEYGRVKCQFPWDRYGKSDENSSCWIRVSQTWAGKKWGAMHIPRIGQEVIVDFLEGDPDQPIITGRVYNGINMPPYTLPDKATVSTLKSNSSKGGDGFNEIRLEDKKDEEQLFIHAQRNQDIRVKKDAMEWIGEERHLIVKKKQFEQVEGEKHQIIKSGDGGAGHHNAKVDGTVSLEIVGDQKEKIGGDQHLEVGSRQNIKTGGTVSLNAGQDLQQKVGMKCAVDAGQEIHLKAGMKVIIEAGMQLTIKAGASFIDIGPAGITISGTPMVKIVGGPMVMINSGGGSAGSGSGWSPASPVAPTAPTAPKEADKAESGQVSDTQAQSPAQQQSHNLDSVTVDNSQMDNSDSEAGGGGSSSARQPRHQTEPEREQHREREDESKEEEEEEEEERIRQNRQAESAKNASQNGRPFRKP